MIEFFFLILGIVFLICAGYLFYLAIEMEDEDIGFMAIFLFLIAVILSYIGFFMIFDFFNLIDMRNIKIKPKRSE